MKLNLGCQLHYFPGWVNVDIVADDKDLKVDVVADAGDIPMISSGTVDFIYAGHLVEHFYPDTLPAAIKEWHRVLKPGGKLVIVTPDCGSIFKDYAVGKLDGIEATWQQIYGRIYHYDRDSERHHIAFDEPTLLRITRATGDGNGHPWHGWDRLNFNKPPEELAPFMGVHISTGAYQLGLILTK